MANDRIQNIKEKAAGAVGELRDQAAARLGGTEAQEENPAKPDRSQVPYEERTADELRQRAQDLGISGTSKMNKDELVAELRRR